MDSYKAYRDARNLAWQILIQYELFDFPIDCRQLARRMKIIVNDVPTLPVQAYALSFHQNGEYLIGYIRSGNVDTDRFTIAHEIGHILMQHIESPNEYAEQQANVFASRLLSPIIVIRHHEMHDALELTRFFGISEEAAQIRWDRYMLLRERNEFLRNPNEQIYYDLYCRHHKFAKK